MAEVISFCRPNGCICTGFSVSRGASVVSLILDTDVRESKTVQYLAFCNVLELVYVCLTNTVI